MRANLQLTLEKSPLNSVLTLAINLPTWALLKARKQGVTYAC